ncbi:hypothetical protein [Hymenobacter ruricola]|uniref:hypothetical protein n=1 Tax=Hymenobacter ruricola TaxID=2791023 RepID=UPI0018AF92AB|nr:hypothetical protein [Hymenobacter ruricola]
MDTVGEKKEKVNKANGATGGRVQGSGGGQAAGIGFTKLQPKTLKRRGPAGQKLNAPRKLKTKSPKT